MGDFAGKNMLFIKASNSDKDCSATSAMWRLTVPCAVTIFLDFWGGAQHEDHTGAAQWLKSKRSGWQATSLRGVTFSPSYGPGRVFKQTFPSGAVEIMGNGGLGHGLFLAFLECHAAIAWGSTPAQVPQVSLHLEGWQIKAGSGRKTTVLGSVPDVGDFVWHDRSYVFTSLGSFAGRDMLFVKASNDDKHCAAETVLWTLDTPCAATVYLDFWGSKQHTDGTDANRWLRVEDSAWELTSMQGVAFTPSYGPGQVFKQTFPAGRIEIMGKGPCNHGCFLAFVECVASFVLTVGLASAGNQPVVLRATSLAGREELLELPESASFRGLMPVLSQLFDVPASRVALVMEGGGMLPREDLSRDVLEVLASAVRP